MTACVSLTLSLSRSFAIVQRAVVLSCPTADIERAPRSQDVASVTVGQAAKM